MSKPLTRKAQERFESLWREIEALHPDVRQTAPGVFKFGRKKYLSFSLDGKIVRVDVRWANGSTGGFSWQPTEPVPGPRFMLLARMALDLPPEPAVPHTPGPDGEALLRTLLTGGAGAQFAAFDALERLNDDQLAQRAWTAAQAGEVGDAGHPVGTVKRLALSLLAKSGPRAAATIAEALHDEDAKVVAEAIAHLGDLRASKQVPKILLHTDGPGPVRQAVARALGMIGGAEAVRALCSLLETDDLVPHPCGVDRQGWRVRDAAAKALGAIGGAKATRALETRLAVETKATVKKTLRSLLELSKKKATKKKATKKKATKKKATKKKA